MEVRHLHNTVRYTLDARVFNLLCENFCLLEHPLYVKAIHDKYITLTNLASLARAANLSYSLFFAQFTKIKALIDTQNDELFGTLDEKFILGTRGELLDIRWVRRIVLDLSRKQKLFSKYRRSDRLNNIVGRLKTSRRTIREQADYVLEATDIDMEVLRKYSNKRDVLKYLRACLAKKNIHVSIEAQNCMPQSVPEKLKKSLSGFYIRDPRNPYLFICNELSGHPEAGAGRKIYTLLFLLVCIFKDKSYAVSISRDTYRVDKKKYRQLEVVHAIVNEILMPRTEIDSESIYDYDSLSKAASRYKVTPKALLQRLYDTRVIQSYSTYDQLSDECKKHFDFSVQQNRNRHGGSPSQAVMVEYYQGDFLHFLRTEVPQRERNNLAKKHVLFNRLSFRLEQG